MEPERARELLAQERRRIELAIAELTEQDKQAAAEQGEPGELGSEDLYEKELEEGLTEDLAEQLAAVERADARLAAGTYGISVDSGEPIPDERLEALPAAERTVEEQRVWMDEHSGAHPRGQADAGSARPFSIVSLAYRTIPTGRNRGGTKRRCRMLLLGTMRD